MASIINTYDANSTQVYPKTSTDALVFNDGEKQGAEAIAAALSKNHENLKIGNIEIVPDRELKSPKVIAGQVVAESITDNGNLVVVGNTNLNSSLTVHTGNVSVMSGEINVSGDIDVSVGHVKAPKANFDDCSFGPIRIDGNAKKIYVTGDTILDNGAYSYTLQQLATQTGAERHLSYSDTSLYVTGVASIANSSKTYTDPSVYIKNGNLYTKGLYVGGDLEANQIDPTKIVLKQTSTNLMSGTPEANEFNFIPANYIGNVNINYKTEGNRTGKILKYVFYDGSRGRTELDAATYRCRGGRTYLTADPSANGQLIIGSDDPSIRTYIQKDRVVVENATGASTFSKDSIILSPNNRYIKSSDTKLTAVGAGGYSSYIQIQPQQLKIQAEWPDEGSVYNSNISLSEQGVSINSGGVSINSGELHVNTQTTYISNNFRVGLDSSMNGKLKVQGDTSLYSKLYVQGDTKLNSKLNVVGDVSINGTTNIYGNVSLHGAFNIGSEIVDLNGDTHTASNPYFITPDTPKLIRLSNNPSAKPVHIRVNDNVPVGNVYFIMSSFAGFVKYYYPDGNWYLKEFSAMLVKTGLQDYRLIGVSQ